MNRERASAGCAPVRVDSNLTSAAQAHSDDMATHNRLSHESSDGTSFDERVESYGYPDPAAENVAMGLSSADAVLQNWMTSETHRDNILDCDVTAIGVGVNSDGWYWTLDFGY
ncbi:CAP domain-containing protein [Prauserella oleivorans]|uniref:CAP domain-containing protein n=1 Tax=Prauserella oleivorans TaxID=1478153 RepID=A0ABW5WJZ8_9PSEU